MLFKNVKPLKAPGWDFLCNAKSGASVVSQYARGALHTS